MKKLILNILFITFCTCVYSQAPDEQKFFGTWKWKNGNKELILFMKYDTVKKVTSIPLIIGFHRYIRNDSVVQDYMPLYLPEYASSGEASFGGLLDNNNSNVFIGSIFDKEMNKNGRLYLTFIYPNKLKFELMSMNAPQGKGAGFSLPTGIILTKQP